MNEFSKYEQQEEIEIKDWSKTLEPTFRDSYHQQNEVLVERADKNSAKVRAIIKPSKEEAADFPKGFFVQMESVLEAKEAGPVLNSGNGQIEMYDFNCKDVQFLVGGKKVNFSEILPDDTNFVIKQCPTTDRSYGNGFYNPLTKTIEITTFSKIDAFFTLLHEAGHAIDFFNKGVNKGGPEVKTQDELSKYTDSRGLRDIERCAWAEALKIARAKGLPTKQIRKAMKKSLCGYGLK